MKNEFAIINGSTGGIGSEIAYKLSENFDLILLGRNKKKLNQLAKNIKI
jgi:short-subunit dehydrogenase